MHRSAASAGVDRLKRDPTPDPKLAAELLNAGHAGGWIALFTSFRNLFTHSASLQSVLGAHHAYQDMRTLYPRRFRSFTTHFRMIRKRWSDSAPQDRQPGPRRKPTEPIASASRTHWSTLPAHSTGLSTSQSSSRSDRQWSHKCKQSQMATLSSSRSSEQPKVGNPEPGRRPECAMVRNATGDILS